MKILSIVGARPQFVKAAVVTRALHDVPACSSVLVHTGQHYDFQMSDAFFVDLELSKPDHFLGVGSGSHGAQTGRMLESIERVLLLEKPDWTLVFGDTNTTLAGALAAAKLHFPTAHVEAGLRSFDRRMPEELNRIVADHMADVLFAPTAEAVTNLAAEGIGGERVKRVGDVMYDAALYYADKAATHQGILAELGLKTRGYVLATIHRAENTDNEARLDAIVEGLSLAARRIPVVLPLHPRTQKVLKERGLLDALETSGVRLLPPVGYLDMIVLEKNAKAIATDSGGVQKEAFFFRVPCRTLRDSTEWPELVELGWNQLISPLAGPNAVAEGLLQGLETLGRDADPYGGGMAGQRIVKALVG